MLKKDLDCIKNKFISGEPLDGKELLEILKDLKIKITKEVLVNIEQITSFYKYNEYFYYVSEGLTDDAKKYTNFNLRKIIQ